MLDLPLTLTDIVLKPARICLITRMDGEIIRIAEAQTDLVVDGETYSPLGGFQMSAVKQQVGGEASSVQLDAAMSIGGLFDLYEVVDGKFDNATVQVGMVNRASPSVAGFLFKGFIGPTTFGTLHNVVSFDVRGYSLKTMWPFIQQFGPMCRADFGDDLCRVPLRPSIIGRSQTYTTRLLATSVDHYAGRISNGSSSDPDQYANIFFECTTAGVTAGSAPSFNFSVGATTTDGTAVFTARNAWTRHAKITSVTNQFNVVLDRDPDPRGVTGWYNQGAIRMWDGYSATRVFEIGAWVLSTRTLTLYLPIGAANNDTLIHAGDWLEIWPGCDFTIAKCSGTYANSEQFRGEPYFAGADLVGAPTGGTSTGGYWAPGDLDSIALWFDFSDASTIIHAANAISQVNDKSGNNLHVTQVGAAAKPTLVAVGLNGRSIATFDVDHLSRTTALGSLVPSNNQTMLVVANPTNPTGGYVYFGQNGTVAGAFFLGTSAARMQGNSNNFASYDPSAGWHVYTSYILTTLREVYEDGVVQASNSVVETSESAPVSIWIGDRPGAPLVPFAGSVAEIIICNGQLSTPDRQKLEGYAAHKWNLTINLPSNHPYKISPP